MPEVSTHYLISKKGIIYNLLCPSIKAWHAGESSYKGIEDCNDYSIGIELEGSDNDYFSDEQYKMIIKTTKSIIKNYSEIDKDKIVGHSDIAPGRKTDPGNKFEWNRYFNAL